MTDIGEPFYKWQSNRLLAKENHNVCVIQNLKSSITEKKQKKELDKILNPKSESKTEEESRVEKIIEYKKRKRGDE